MKKITITIVLLVVGIAISAYVYTQVTKHETDSTIVGSQVIYGHTAGGGIVALQVDSDGIIQVKPNPTPAP